MSCMSKLIGARGRAGDEVIGRIVSSCRLTLITRDGGVESGGFRVVGRCREPGGK